MRLQRVCYHKPASGQCNVATTRTILEAFVYCFVVLTTAITVEETLHVGYMILLNCIEHANHKGYLVNCEDHLPFTLSKNELLLLFKR